MPSRLSSITGRDVADRTGLSGRFDIDVEWALTEAQVAALAQVTPPGGTPPAIDPDKPGRPGALQEQLGVRLDSTTGPVEVLRIDGIERPTEN